MFCGPQICQKCVGGWGSARTPLGELTTLPQPLVGWRGGTPSPVFTTVGAFGDSILALSALSFYAPQCKILATPLVNSGRYCTPRDPTLTNYISIFKLLIRPRVIAVTAVCSHVLALKFPAGDSLATSVQPDADDTEAEPEQTSDTAE